MSLVNELNLSKQIELTGYQSNPYPYIKNSSLLLMASSFEGFSNVAIEAWGVPILAFICPGGLNDIIVQGFNGWFVDNGDISGYSEGINRALSQNVDKNQIIKRTKEMYDVNKIVSKYEEVLMNI